MKKRILILLLTLSLVLGLSAVVSASHNGIEETEESEKIQIVQLLEIMNGDEYGNMNLDDTVTRAEFVKMVINASSYKDSVSSLSVSVFPDVTSAHWAAPYISVAVKNGYITGYLDGTFKPENTVKLEEAVNVVLKMLGYTNADFEGTYPDAQLAKCSEIDLDTAISAVKGQALTRRECMKLIYNMLCTKMKNGAYYCQAVLGYAVDAESETIDLDLVLEDKMKGPYINTKEEPWLKRVSFEGGANTTYFLNGKRVNTVEVGEYDVYYYSEKARTLWIYNRKEFGKIGRISPNKTSPESFAVENGTSSYMLTDESSDRFLALGLDVDDYVMIVFDKDDKVADIMTVDYELYNKFADDDLDLLEEVNRSISKPIIVSGKNYLQKIPFALDGADIICDSEIISASDIKDGDVLYYSALANSVWVYRETESGLCSAITPGRENPSAVVVGGKSYTLATDEVKYKFSNFGTLKTENLVTLVLGKDGSVVDARAADMSVIGDGENQVSYTEIVNATLKGPYVVKENGKLNDGTEINIESAVIYKDNTVSGVSDIDRYNVYYYSKLLNTVWIYDDSKSGVVEAVSPNRVSPSSITLSGKTYTLESESVKYEFSGMGSYKVGDRVTLLLGKDGSAAGVVRADEIENKAVYGVVLSKGEKTYTDADGKSYIADTITVFATDGNVYTYQTKANPDTGKPVMVVVGENGVNVTGLSSPKSQSYAVNAADAVKNGKFADNAQIIEYYDESVYGKVLESRIAGRDIWYTDIIYYKLNEDGEIEILILDNYTGDLVEYGLLTEVNGSYYEYIIDGAVKSYSSGDTRFTVRKGAAYFAMSGDRIKKIGNITTETDIAVINRNKAYSSKNEGYEIADDVKVYMYDYTDYEYKLSDLDELVSSDYSEITGYYDKAVSAGGKIRVITASK